MVAAPAAFASDFVTGVAVGQMLSDDSGSKKVEDTGPESKTVIDYHDGQPVVTKVEAFKSNKWRKLDGPQGGYFVCPGEYRSYSGRLRCRIHDDGFNGFMGGMTDAQELPLQEALTKLEGKPIALQTIEVHGNNLAVKYQLAPPAPTYVKTQDLGVVKQEGEVQNQPPAPASLSVTKADSTKQEIAPPNTGSNVSSFQSPFEHVSDAMIGFLDSTLMRVVAIAMLFFGIATGIMRQNLSAFVMGIMPAMMLITAPTVFRSVFDTGAASAKPVEESGSSFPFFLVAIVPVLIFFAYRAFMNNRSDSEIDELLREARRAERAERPSNEPPSVDELRERQQQNPEREPVVVSSSAPAPKVQKEEPIEVQPGKRKIILD
ncbi:TraA family conjugative transfer protein [Escherichia coli]